MKLIVDIFVHNKDLITVLISSGAFILSVISFFRNLDHISVDIGKPELISAVILSDQQSILSDYGLYHVNVHVINTSNHSIGFFEVLVTNKSNEQYELYTNQVIAANINPDAVIKSFIAKDDQQYFANVPESNFGTFAAKQFNSVDFFFVGTSKQAIDQLTFSLKLAVNHFNWWLLLPHNWKYIKDQRSKYRIIYKSFRLSSVDQRSK